MRILVIQHDADKGLGLFTPPLASHELDIQFAGHGEIGLSGHGAVIALPGVANPDDATDAVDATRDVLREALQQGLPILGICLGAELLAEAAGGVTGRCRRSGGIARCRSPPRVETTICSATCQRSSRSSRRTTTASICRRTRSPWPTRPRAAGVSRRRQRVGRAVPPRADARRCSTAGLGALGHVMAANGVDPEATRRLGRRYVPEWAEHAAAMGRRFAAVAVAAYRRRRRGEPAGRSPRCRRAAGAGA